MPLSFTEINFLIETQISGCLTTFNVNLAYKLVLKH